MFSRQKFHIPNIYVRFSGTFWRRNVAVKLSAAGQLFWELFARRVLITHGVEEYVAASADDCLGAATKELPAEVLYAQTTRLPLSVELMVEEGKDVISTPTTTQPASSALTIVYIPYGRHGQLRIERIANDTQRVKIVFTEVRSYYCCILASQSKVCWIRNTSISSDMSPLVPRNIHGFVMSDRIAKFRAAAFDLRDGLWTLDSSQ